MNLHFINAKIFRNGHFTEGDLWVENGRVSYAPHKQPEIIDVEGNYLVPGFIDLQINGSFGVDFTSNPDSVDKVSSHLPTFGVTSFLATVVTSTPEAYRKVLPIINRMVGKTRGAELLGIHLEGPCFHQSQSKAHDESLIRSCSDFSSPEDCYGSLEGVKIVTLAPEVPGAAQWISHLSKSGIVVSAGHTLATAVQMEEAIAQGVTMATHLFNGMGPIHHREPGIVGAVLHSNGFYYSIIADSVHVDRRILNIAWRVQPEGLILVSDAVAAAGMPEGEFALGSKNVILDRGVVKTKDGELLAGCGEGLSSLVKKFRAMTGASIGDTVRTVTEKPARLLGMYPQKGSLEIGADADIVILNKDCEVVSCFVKGERV